MKRICLVILLFSVAVAAFAADMTVDEAHEGLSCADCHNTDTPVKRPPVSACLACHDSYAAVAERTKRFSPNPHDSHQGELRCSLCHSPHKEDKLYCNECHDLQIYKFK